jgi:hypothetical protein
MREEYQLPDSVRARVAHEAAEKTLQGRNSWLLPMPFATARMALVGAAAALCVALLTSPLMQRNEPPVATHDEVRSIRVVAEGGVVRLAWSDGVKASYTVHKTTDLRHPGQGEVHVVRGKTTWTDTDPGPSPIVFYRID